jgi:hypothetical protein
MFGRAEKLPFFSSKAINGVNISLRLSLVLFLGVWEALPMYRFTFMG